MRGFCFLLDQALRGRALEALARKAILGRMNLSPAAASIRAPRYLEPMHLAIGWPTREPI